MPGVYVFKKMSIPKKKNAIHKTICHNCCSNIEHFLNFYWNIEQHVYYRFLQRKQGVIVLVFSENL